MNSLAREASPYLQAHASEPVDWHPWGPAAQDLASRQDRPILLAIGYSACHWCHVMAKESFADPVTAELMNRHFVCVQVDREEHPEVDQLYQQAYQLLARRSGGWPLTLFLSPDGIPFYGGTYYPAEAHAGLPAFRSVLEKVAQAWRRQRQAIAAQGPQLLEALRLALNAHHPPASGKLDRAAVRACRARLLEQFDPRHGGFGQQAKFPQPAALEFLLHAGVLREDEEARHAALHSLRKMANSGLADQLGGGFFRYCSDAAWARPHFEKMLLDNAQLLWLYSEAFALTGEALFRRTACTLGDWLLREMPLPQGGFGSALNADTDGSEGSYYLWSRAEISSLLDGERLALIIAHFGLDSPGLAADQPCHLCVQRPLEEVAGTLAIPPHTARQHLDAALARLLQQRETRPRPERDAKLLSAANAHAIRALARAASVFTRPEWLEAARRALASLLTHNLQEGRLATCSLAGQCGPAGVLDDYAALLTACLELLQAGFRQEDLALARQLADTLLDAFEDTTEGGFSSTAHDAPALIARTRPIKDQASPAGNPLAARSLLRLGHLLGEARYLTAAERCLRAFHASLGAHSHSAGMALLLEEWVSPPVLAILRGQGDEARAWHAELRRQCHPDLVCLYLPAGLSGLPGALDKPSPPSSSAWVCRGSRCLPPCGTLRELQAAIEPEPDYLPESWMHISSL